MLKSCTQANYGFLSQYCRIGCCTCLMERNRLAMFLEWACFPPSNHDSNPSCSTLVACDQQHDSSVFRQWHVYMHSTYPQMYHYALIHTLGCQLSPFPVNSDQLGIITITTCRSKRLPTVMKNSSTNLTCQPWMDDQPGHWKRWWQRGCQRGAVGTFLWSLKWWIVFLHFQTPNPPKKYLNQRNLMKI